MMRSAPQQASPPAAPRLRKQYRRRRGGGLPFVVLRGLVSGEEVGQLSDFPPELAQLACRILLGSALVLGARELQVSGILERDGDLGVVPFGQQQLDRDLGVPAFADDPLQLGPKLVPSLSSTT